MAEESQVRFVRCFKCKSLLQELREYSFYKCGSCGAVLQAKKKEPASNGFLDKPIEEKGRGGCEEVDSQLDKGGSLRSASETEICGVEGISRRKERTFGEKSMNFNSVSARINKENVYLGDDKKVREHKHEHNRAEKGVGYVDNYMPSSKNPVNNWAQRDDQDMNMNRSKSVNSSRGSKVEDYSPKLANFAGSLRLKGVTDMRGVDRDGFGGFYKRSLRTIDEQDRFSVYRYPDEGPSNYRYGSAYGYHKPVKSFGYLDVPSVIKKFDRTQLLKELDELKDQLLQRPRDMVPSDNIIASSDPLGGSIGNKSSAHHRSAQYPHVSELTYLNHSSMNDDDHVQNYGKFHPASKHVRRKIPGCGDSLSPCMHRRWHQQVTHYHHQHRTYGYSSRHNEDLLASYPNPDETLYHLPSCSCLHCSDKNLKGPLQVPPDFSKRRFLKDPCNSNFNHYVNSDGVQQHYLPRTAQCPLVNFQDSPVHVWPSDIDSDIDGFGRRCPRRVVLACRDKQICHPIANGAPFITCHKCLALLKLPRKFRKTMKNDQRLRCGACSTAIVFEMEKRLINSVPGNPKRRPTEAEQKSSELLNVGHLSSHGCFNAGATIPSSRNVEHSGYDQTSSKDVESPDNVIDWKDSPGSPEQPSSYDVCPAVSSLPFQDQVSNPSSNQAVSGSRKGNRTKLAQEEKVILLKNASQVVSEKNAPVATEVEVSFSGYLNSSSSKDTLQASKEENQLKLHKGSKSFLVGLIKKSFRDCSRSNDNIKNERPNVLVNGQDMSDSAVRKAEKQAGPIRPGNYW
ncbi:Uncharacterized protein TCM_016413 isoform 4 [Theobroma cacao]|uniref:Uncharacterized protein isoform 4 n=1 Tax=Theobroma cacao TaxID=3641 RepID=A0A061G526_THECC|nr:Uncharacterized protein TCM_016413 isoform 4 [Theobroma cacao]